MMGGSLFMAYCLQNKTSSTLLAAISTMSRLSDEKNNNNVASVESIDVEQGSHGLLDFTHKGYTTKRTLTSRNLHFIAIGGSIGTGLFVTISTGLLYGGPMGLFLAFLIWTGVIFAVTASCGEYVCYLPIESPFIQIAGRCVDKAFEAAVGWNYYLMISIYIPFEITAVNGMIHYWTDDYSPAIAFCIQIFIYTVLNVMAVRWFGESEFYLTIGKVLLATGLIFFTFITMLGGNPQHDRFGFRYWQDPGLFNVVYTTGSMGQFHGFMAALNKACFTIVGPEYLSMVANEAGQETRKVLATTFRTVFYRLIVFYVLGALCVGILLPYNDETLNTLASSGSTSNGSYSPYIIAMSNLRIKVLPDIVNVLCVTSAFSAGNSYVYCSSRALYGMARRGNLVPFSKVFCYCTKNGVPIFCVFVAFCFSLLSLLQLGDSAAQVLNWIVNLCSGAQILNYFFMCVTYVGFYRACQAQGLDRHKFTYTSWFQPYTAIFAGFIVLLMVGALGYTVFMPGQWNVENFLTYYLMVLLSIGIFIFYKIVFRTKFVDPAEADLYTGLDEIEAHEAAYLEERRAAKGSDDPKTKWGKIVDYIL